MLTLAESYIHSLDPVIVELPAGLQIRWYGVSYVLGFIVAWLMLRWMARTKRILLQPAQVSDFMMYAIAGVVIGGRLGYCLFYDLPRGLEEGYTPLLWDFSSQIPFWGVLRFGGGGMASHGGMIGVILGCLFFARRHKVPFLHITDFAALATPIGLGLGRVANFINGELWGKPLPDAQQGTNAPWWSVKYPEELHHMIATHQGKALDALDVARAMNIDPADWSRQTWSYGQSGTVGQEATRVVTGWMEQIPEQLRSGNEALEKALQPLLTAFYPSQLIQAFAEGLVLFVALALIWWKPRRIGVVSAAFLIVYATLRIVTEMFRQPDEGVDIIFGLQRGQLLSVLMFAVAAGVITWIVRRKPDRLGGLGRQAMASES